MYVRWKGIWEVTERENHDLSAMLSELKQGIEKERYQYQKMFEMYERQLKVQDNEIRRLQTQTIDVETLRNDLKNAREYISHLESLLFDQEHYTYGWFVQDDEIDWQLRKNKI